MSYDRVVPRLWSESIEAHRHDVREAVIDTTRRLAEREGLLSVTMSQIAEESGIGRATLYKYFPNVEAILVAHHDRHVAAHLQHLTDLRDGPGDADERLKVVAQEYALICFHRQQHGSQELTALLHRHDHVIETERQIHRLFQDLLDEVAAMGRLSDGSSSELASYCVHALAAAGSLDSRAAVGRLVAVTLRGLITT